MKRESRLHRPLSDAIAVELTAKALRADLEGGALKRELSHKDDPRIKNRRRAGGASSLRRPQKRAYEARKVATKSGNLATGSTCSLKQTTPRQRCKPSEATRQRGLRRGNNDLPVPG